MRTKPYYLMCLSVLSILTNCTDSNDKKTPIDQHANLSKIYGKDTMAVVNIKNKTWTVVTATVNGKKANLLFDSGAGNILLDSSFVRDSGLLSNKYYLDTGSAKQKRLKFIARDNYFKSRNINLQMGGINYLADNTMTIDLKRLSHNSNVQGIIGAKMISKYVLEINYEKGYVVFHDPQNFKKPVVAATIPVSVGGFPFMKVKFNINDNLSIYSEVAVDLGCSPTAVIWGTYAVEKHKLIDLIPDKTLMAPQNNKTTTGETITGYSAKIKSVVLGDNIIVDTPTLHLNTSKSGVSGSNIILMGNYIMSRFKRVYYDMSGGFVYIVK